MAVNFDGTNDYILTSDTDIGASTYSLSAWISTPNQGTAAGYIFEFRDSSGSGYFYLQINGNGLDFPNGTCYVDGVSGETDVPYDGNLHHVALSGVSLNIQTIRFGRRYTASDYLNGIMTDAAIWEATLSEAEILQIYNSKIKRMPLQIQPSSLILYLPLDDHPHNDSANSANGLVFKDLSGNGNDGTASGCNAQSETYLSYPASVIVPAISEGEVSSPSPSPSTSVSASPSTSVSSSPSSSPSAPVQTSLQTDYWAVTFESSPSPSPSTSVSSSPSESPSTSVSASPSTSPSTSVSSSPSSSPSTSVSSSPSSSPSTSVSASPSTSVSASPSTSVSSSPSTSPSTSPSSSPSGAAAPDNTYIIYADTQLKVYVDGTLTWSFDDA